MIEISKFAGLYSFILVARYLTTAQFMGNGFLKAQGYQKSLMFDPQKPAESLSKIANAIAKRQFALNIDSGTYIKPAVTYMQVTIYIILFLM